MENRLKNLEEFKKILADYHVSKKGESILKDVRFVALSGLSSSGRNTVMRELVKTGRYHFIISDTTRKPRINDNITEKNGVEYWFKTEEQMLHALKAGQMLEAEIIHEQQVSGISIAELKRAKQKGKIAITDIEIGGFKNLLKAKPDTTAVVLLPPSFDEWQMRLDRRGKMPTIEKKRRLRTAIRVLNEAISRSDLNLVVNYDFHETVKVFTDLENHSLDQEKAREVAKKLLEETKSRLIEVD